MLTKPVLSQAEAKQIAAAAVAEATAQGWNVSVAIVDDGGHLLYLERMDAAPKASATVAPEKARSASLFRRPTKAFEEAIAGGRTVMLKLPLALPIEGGLPLTVAGVAVGGIGVSGVQSHQDAQIARAGIAAVAELDQPAA